MNHLPKLIIAINILGLLMVQVLEAWRPGSVAGLMSIGWLFVWATISTMVVALISRQR